MKMIYLFGERKIYFVSYFTNISLFNTQFYGLLSWQEMWLIGQMSGTAPLATIIYCTFWQYSQTEEHVFWTNITPIVFLFLHFPVSFKISLLLTFLSLFFSPSLFLSFSLLMHAVWFFSLIHQYTIVQWLPFSDANYLPKWGCEALCLPAQSFIDHSVS